MSTFDASFKSGNIPWNKGTHIITNTGKTWFKKGMVAPNKGKILSEETKRKISESKKGIPSPKKGMGNPEKSKENRKLYRLKHKEEKKEYDRLYRIRIHDKKIKNDRLYYLNNKEKIKKQNKQYLEKNKQKMDEYRKEYREKTKEHKRNYDIQYRAVKNLYKNDIHYKIKSCLSARLRIAIKSKNGSKSQRTMELIGCSIEFFKSYFEKLFKPGMTWENHGLYGWHFDHIIPCYEFDLTNPKEQKKCFHYTNLQPLWAKENLKKWRTI